MTAFAAVLLLAGGEGRRLGGPKAELDWDGEPLLVRVAGRLAALAPRIVVSARGGQDLPGGPWDRVDDALAGQGPLAGLAAGLTTIAQDSPDGRVAVAACDYPFADPALFEALAARAPDADVALPRHAEHIHPLHAVWRTAAGATCAAALAEGERRVRAALDRLDTHEFEARDLTAAADPGRALLNLNDPADLARARRSATPGS